MTDRHTITDQTVGAFADAYRASLAAPTPSDPPDQTTTAIRAGLAAAAPHIAAQALRAYADREHPAEPDAGYCSGCGYAFIEAEGGCTERTSLLQAADGLAAPVPLPRPLTHLNP